MIVINLSILNISFGVFMKAISLVMIHLFCLEVSLLDKNAYVLTPWTSLITKRKWIHVWTRTNDRNCHPVSKAVTWKLLSYYPLLSLIPAVHSINLLTNGIVLKASPKPKMATKTVLLYSRLHNSKYPSVEPMLFLKDRIQLLYSKRQ